MEHIVDVFNRNRNLFEEWSIRSPEEFLKNKHWIYCEHEGILRETLSNKDYRYLKEDWLRNSYRGRDNCPACIKVSITWKHSETFTPRDRDYLETVKVEFDRVKSQAKYFCESHKKINGTIKADLSAKFEKEFFCIAECAYYESTDNHPYMMDSHSAVVKCVFSNGVVAESRGTFPDYFPYDRLYGMAQIKQLVDQINRQSDTL